MSELTDKETKIDAYIDAQIAAKVIGNWEWRRIKYKETQKRLLEAPPLTIEDIEPTKDITDFLEMQHISISPQIYYLLKKIKELEARVYALEHPVTIDPIKEIVK